MTYNPNKVDPLVTAIVNMTANREADKDLGLSRTYSLSDFGRRPYFGVQSTPSNEG